MIDALSNRHRFLYGILISILLLASLACSLWEDDTDGGGSAKASFAEIDDVLANPYKGFVPWIGEDNPIYDAKLQVATFNWSDLEPVKGQFNWSLLEQNWGDVATTGKRVGFRVNAANPHSGHVDIPQWLVDEGVALRPYDIDDMQGLAPDWDDPKFLAAHHDFILALGARYDSDLRVAWIDIGSYGFWGEWHVWLNESLAATTDTKRTILEHYFEAFPTKAKVIAFDDDFATRYVVEHGGGIRNDCLGTQGSNDWYLESIGDLNDTVWKTAIITGEFCGSAAGAIAGTTERFDINYQFIQDTHWSFIGSSGGAIEPQSEEHRQNLDKLHKKLGYRFVLRQATFPEEVTAGSTFNFQLALKNRGAAPFYFEWPLVLYFVDSADTAQDEQVLDIDIRTWLPGDVEESIEVAVPTQLTPGKYDLRIAIHDPDTGEPGILFANEGKDDGDRYQLGEIRIVD